MYYEILDHDRCRWYWYRASEPLNCNCVSRCTTSVPPGYLATFYWCFSLCHGANVIPIRNRKQKLACVTLTVGHAICDGCNRHSRFYMRFSLLGKLIVSMSIIVQAAQWTHVIRIHSAYLVGITSRTRACTVWPEIGRRFLFLPHIHQQLVHNHSCDLIRNSDAC